MSKGEVDAVASVIDNEVVRRIDAIDNGIAHPCDALGLSSLVEDFNSAWDSGVVGEAIVEDAAFIRAADMMRDVLERRVEKVRAPRRRRYGGIGARTFR